MCYNLMVSKSITFELLVLMEIQKKIGRGEISSLSEFVQKAVKNEIKKG